MNTAPRDESDCPTFWLGGSRHDGQDPSAQWPILSLARVLVQQQPNGDVDDLPGTLFNLWNAERQPGAGLVRYLGMDDASRTVCVGFLAWARIDRPMVRRIRRDDVRVVPEEWYRPQGAVVFVTEAMSFTSAPIMVQALRYVSELPGVQMVCGWRKGRFRIQKRRR